VINVALGGTLYSHILDQMENALDHSYNPKLPTNHPAHTINLKTNSLLAEIFEKESVTVNSLHHQGAKEIAPSLETIGWAPDGLAEAFVLPEHPFGLAVQWHPEWMSDDPHMPKLFAAFQRASMDYHSKKVI
jgi:gamma-glutamyl-gamma-aminobutyrate hydrolase PuuD